MPGNCCVPKCSAKGGFKFPKDEELCLKWRLAVNRLGPKNTLWVPSKHSLVCHQHFRPEDFRHVPFRYGERDRRDLVQGAVPSIFSHSADPREEGPSQKTVPFTMESNPANDGELLVLEDDGDVNDDDDGLRPLEHLGDDDGEEKVMEEIPIGFPPDQAEERDVEGEEVAGVGSTCDPLLNPPEEEVSSDPVTLYLPTDQSGGNVYVTDLTPLDQSQEDDASGKEGEHAYKDKDYAEYYDQQCTSKDNSGSPASKTDGPKDAADEGESSGSEGTILVESKREPGAKSRTSWIETAPDSPPPKRERSSPSPPPPNQSSDGVDPRFQANLHTDWRNACWFGCDEPECSQLAYRSFVQLVLHEQRKHAKEDVRFPSPDVRRMKTEYFWCRLCDDDGRDKGRVVCDLSFIKQHMDQCHGGISQAGYKEAMAQEDPRAHFEQFFSEQPPAEPSAQPPAEPQLHYRPRPKSKKYKSTDKPADADQTYECGVCLMTCRNLNLLVQHVNHAHKDALPGDQSSIQFGGRAFKFHTCRICEASVFCGTSYMEKHLRQEHSITLEKYKQFRETWKCERLQLPTSLADKEEVETVTLDSSPEVVTLDDSPPATTAIASTGVEAPVSSATAAPKKATEMKLATVSSSSTKLYLTSDGVIVTKNPKPIKTSVVVKNGTVKLTSL